MRILLITQLFDPENAIKGLSFAKDLVALGHEVEVVTTFPSYPGGKIFPGYKMRLRQVENHGGVRVVRIPSYVAHGRSAIKRLLSYASFSAAAFFYSLFAVKRPDVIYSYYPPMVGGVAGVLLGMIRRRPVIYDVQDLWPEAVVATGMLRNQKIISGIEAVVGWVYRHAAGIVVLSDGYKNALLRKGVPANKIHRIYNWCDESRIKPVLGGHQAQKSTFDIVYAGNLGSAQALNHVIDAAALLKQQGEGRIRFVFFGDGIDGERLRQQAVALDLDNVTFRGRVPPEAISAELDAADALLVHLADEPVFAITIPSKTQAYFASGKPVLMAVAGEAADIVTAARAGFAAKPCDAESIASAALELARCKGDRLIEMGLAAKSYYAENMSQKNGVAKVSQVLEHVKARV